MDVYSLLKPVKALVLGDFMFDIYTRGSVHRISPEAPVPVLCVEEERGQPGGAGNAILNLISLGVQVRAVGRVGEDEEGREVVASLKREGAECEGMVFDPRFRTPVKKRMIADNQQLLRVDYEETAPLSEELEKRISLLLPRWMEQVDVIAISDYAKGFLTDTLLGRIIRLGQERKIPVVVDPKGIDFKKYRGSTLLKPNQGEARAACGLDRKAPLDEVGRRILEECGVETLMVTRSREGISLFNKKKGRQDFPAQVHEVKDVTGAGDTVLAVVAAAVANRLEMGQGAILANIAAGIAIERIGCARITLSELSERICQKQLS